jgi:signal transduction histidine kinase
MPSSGLRICWTIHNDPEKRHAYTEVIHSAGLQLLSIIDDISSIATVESGQEKARMNDLNLNRVLRGFMTNSS